LERENWCKNGKIKNKRKEGRVKPKQFLFVPFKVKKPYITHLAKQKDYS